MPYPAPQPRPIIQLDTQLANQIAAGEVVERPASVVKELIENSLDAGATQIDIEVINGGKQLIRIRDNGCGIPKEQLTLALAPHATSKIATLEDLQTLHSYGFRGEALASISSVSRFSLTSRLSTESQGWRAITEGVQMDVTITPAPATEGTRIEVEELFHNTPARRRFLRTDKTEFNQIETVVKQVALANPQVNLTLKHNQRLVRRFRAAYDLKQTEQRLAAICGQQFVDQSVRIDVDHQAYRLSGWLGLASSHRSQTDGQFFYVNQRPVKDKVLSHAMREAYAPLLPEGRYAAYVLFFELPAEQVDVNVHPTKHEVRFHEVRQVHDFILQAVEQCLYQGNALIREELKQQDVASGKSSSGHQLHSQMPAADHKDYQSYNQFIASAYRHHVAEGRQDKPSHDAIQTSVLALPDGQLLLLTEERIGLIQVEILFSCWLESIEPDAEIKSLMYPELLPDRDYSQVADIWQRLAVEIEQQDGITKLVGAPEHWHFNGLGGLIDDYFLHQLDISARLSYGWVPAFIEHFQEQLLNKIHYRTISELETWFRD